MTTSQGTARSRIPLPGVHMAGSDKHYQAHLEVGPHGIALFLTPNAEYPALDVNGTLDEMDVVVRGLQDALAAARGIPAPV